MEITLKAARVNAGLTQVQLANLIGVSEATVVRYESGQASPNIKTFKRMCEIFGTKMEDLILPSNQEILDNDNDQ